MVRNNIYSPKNTLILLLLIPAVIVVVGVVLVSSNLVQKNTENRSKAAELIVKLAPDNASFEQWDTIPRRGDVKPSPLFPTRWTKGWGWLIGTYPFTIERSSDSYEGIYSAKITAGADISVTSGVPLLVSAAGIIGLTPGNYRTSVWIKYSCSDPSAPNPTGRLRVQSSINGNQVITNLTFIKNWGMAMSHIFTVKDVSAKVHQLLGNANAGQLGTVYLDISTIRKGCSVFFDDVRWTSQ